MRKSLSLFVRPAVRLVKPTSMTTKIFARSIVSIEEAKKMPRNYNEMPNDVLLTMAIGGDQDAREERLIREIMAVDNVSW